MDAWERRGQIIPTVRDRANGAGANVTIRCMAAGWERRLLGPTVIVGAAACAAAGGALHGLFCGDHFQLHLISWLDAQQSWRHGLAYPHWTASATYGAGEPRFMFYPP